MSGWLPATHVVHLLSHTPRQSRQSVLHAFTLQLIEKINTLDLLPAHAMYHMSAIDSVVFVHSELCQAGCQLHMVSCSLIVLHTKAISSVCPGGDASCPACICTTIDIVKDHSGPATVTRNVSYVSYRTFLETTK